MSACPPPGCPPNCPPGCPPICPPQIAFNDEIFCDVTCQDGLAFRWVIAAGTVLGQGPTFDIAKTNANLLAGALACQRARLGKICFVTRSLPNGKVGKPYDFTVKAVGGVPWQFPFLPVGCAFFGAVPYDFRVGLFADDPTLGQLPDGLIMGCRQGGNPGQITGTPTTAGTFNFVIRATDAVGAFQHKPFSITIDGGDFGTITPSIMSGTPTAWPGVIPPGTYKVSYVEGAWKPTASSTLFEVNNFPVFRGYRIVYSAGTINFPGPNSSYGSQALVEAAYAGVEQTIVHTGGPVSMYLQDSPYGDNGPGAPNPTFRLST